MTGAAKADYDGIVAFSQTEIVSYADSGPLSAKLLKKGSLKTYIISTKG